ncbi:MAG: FtsK/SpoIIIE domain-containing protein [Gemmataceae bacterium]
MTEPEIIQQQRSILRQLAELATRQNQARKDCRARHEADTNAAAKNFEQVQQRLQAQRDAALSTLEREYRDGLDQLQATVQTERYAAAAEWREARHRFNREGRTLLHREEKELSEAKWALTTVFEANHHTAKEKLHQAQTLHQRVGTVLEQIQGLDQNAEELLRDWRLPRAEKPTDAPVDADASTTQWLRRLKECLEVAGEQLTDLRALKLPRLLRWSWLIGFWALLAGAGLYPAAWLLDWPIGAAASAGAALIVVAVAGLWMYLAARRQARDIDHPLRLVVAEVEAIVRCCQDHATTISAEQRRTIEELKRQHAEDVRQLQEKSTQRVEEIKRHNEQALRQAETTYRTRMARWQQREATERQRIEAHYQQGQATITADHERQEHQLQDRYREQLDAIGTRFSETWERLDAEWREAWTRATTTFAAAKELSERLFPPWDSSYWDDWPPASDWPPVLRLGEMTGHVLSPLADEGTLPFTLPALVPFPRGCSLLLRAGEGGQEEAVSVLRALVLRLLTALPPGRIRFTLMDPGGLGQSFSPFLQLAEWEESLIHTRVWTEPRQIEQRLAEVAEVMETVVQKLLGSQFETIEEYNAHAGEVAEPLRVIVVANFPHNFSAEAVRHLQRIAANGASCGVIVWLSADDRQPLPPGYDWKELQRACVNLVWREQCFQWLDADFGSLPLRLDSPATGSRAAAILKTVGERARQAQRVEVDFEFLAPTAEEWWAGDSRAGLRLPLGRAGALRRQYLELGKGTSQHIVLAGKTGSGKSTLLHVLITQLALRYSPDEVELYLVDFKKGVEFKTYATHHLPHARVIAIESEREFGLSVLQRLDAELKRRGELFRAAQVQDVNGYRNSVNGVSCPRIMLVVDEFQEFFTEDDKIAQEASLLLDRLVRQGRAFGLHVLLGSQTLGGAYSLARSTIDQMAIRIALQCSETDAHLILSKDNGAARLLARPGEAIYNDANGMAEGNNHFQVVWLPDTKRDALLQTVRDRTGDRHWPAPIVFEGNAPALIGDNPLLRELLQADVWPAPPRAASAWLGAALAIKEPTAAVFRPQSGSNLLIVGQQEETALAILTSALLSLAAQYPAPNPDGGARFHILDGTPADSPLAGYLRPLPDILPQPVGIADGGDLAGVLDELAAAVQRRHQEATPDPARRTAIFLFICGLHRLRDLRRAEDDFGFGRREEQQATPAQQWQTIVRDGPAVQVWTCVWCDSLLNVQRAVDRQGLREFEMRVLFQMSPADSSNLIDTPQASKLGLNRALFHNEEMSQAEKFRPYGLPQREWLNWVGERLKKKVTNQTRQADG